MLILMALLLLIRVPIAVALAFSATLALFITEGGSTAIEIIAQRMTRTFWCGLLTTSAITSSREYHSTEFDSREKFGSSTDLFRPKGD